MKEKFNACIAKIIALYLGIPTLIAICLYNFLPIILNYPPDSMDNQFQTELDGITYSQQYVLLISLIVLCSLILLFFRAFRMHKYFKKLTSSKLKKEKVIENLLNVRRLCYDTPYLLYLLEILVPLIFLPVTFVIIDAYPLTILKICLIYISFFTLASVISFVFSKNEFAHIITLLNQKYPEIMQQIELNSSKKRYFSKSLTAKLILQFIPLVMVSLIFLSLVGYVQAAKKTGDVYYDAYMTIFSNSLNKKFENKDDVLNDLKQIPLLENSHEYFIINSDGSYQVSDNGKLEPFFIKYTLENSVKNLGRTYDYFCLDTEGIAIKCNFDNGDYCYAGVRFDTKQPMFLEIILISDILLFIIILTILIYVARSISKDINTVAKRLKDIASSNEKNINLSKKLIVTSEDELADLLIAFNQTQLFTQNNINQIRNNQSILMEKERLASLGQLIGGIAHNLKTPIMSISGAAEGLSDLIKEYDSSIDDPEVTHKDHHDIAKDMNSWVVKIKEYTEYMSDVITAVKGQAVTLSETSEMTFDIDELIKRVDILMKHELKNALISLNISIKTDKHTSIKGDVNSLVQVINNLISNAIQAYNGKPDQSIELVVEKLQNKLYISITDHASGLPKQVQNKLFKEMITTKGKNGTGLGLYMSYSTIKAHFNGDIIFKTKAGKGTTFSIILPL